MLARSRKIELPNGDVIETPILLPSFSSRGFPDVKNIVKHLEEYFYGSLLVSAYDIHYGLVQKRIKFANKLVFVDSGGYESATIVDFAEVDKGHYKPKPWNKKIYEKTVLGILNTEPPKVIISYDHPRERKKINKQIKDANITFDKFSKTGHKYLREFLVKPETTNREKQYIDIDKFVGNVKKFSEYDILGFTENELGNSILERINNISKLRRALAEHDMRQLIHIFGSLDTVATPLYFICGADIFDGLTWLRYAYDEGYTTYMRDYWVRRLPHNKPDIYSRQATFVKNFEYLQELLLRMKRFLKTNDFHEFEPHGEILRHAWDVLETQKKEGI